MRMTVVLASATLLIAGSASYANDRDSDGRVFGNVFRVFKPTDDGSPGTLRWAILQANSSPGLDKILIEGRGRGPLVIKPNSLLPTLQGPLVVEGDRDWRREDGHGRHSGRGPDVVIDGSNFIDTSTILSCPGENPA